MGGLKYRRLRATPFLVLSRAKAVLQRTAAASSSNSLGFVEVVSASLRVQSVDLV